MSKIFVKPGKDRKVRDPQTGLHLPTYGKGVTPSAYWTRRLAAKDVETTTEAAIAKARAAEAKTAATDKE